MELIRIEKKDGKQSVSARELYKFLDLSQSQFSRWAKMNITQNVYATEHEDWEGFDIVVGGNRTKDFALSLNLAKKICMISPTVQGNKARDYFIECERRAKEAFKIPATFSEALLLASKQAEKIEQQEKLLLEQKPKADFFDQVAQSKTAIEMRKVVAVLDMGIGRNKLFEFLREEKILDNQNIPYRKYQDAGYFRVVEQKYTDGNGELKINFKTMVYQKGINYIRKKLTEERK